MSAAMYKRGIAMLSVMVALSLHQADAVAAEAPAPAVAVPAASLSAPKGATQRVDSRGFVRRWLVLEPVQVSNRLTESAVREAVQAGPSIDLLTLPAEGAIAEANGPRRWHAVESVRYNVNLFHFARSHAKPTSNVLFRAAAVIDSPAEQQGVRLAICSNAASVWWLNGERVVALYDDRQSVIDDGVSKRLTLKKGRNVLHAAIVNGGGATDFCARFLDARNEPITNLTVSLRP